jgi:DNA-binding response OmpR family regulator
MDDTATRAKVMVVEDDPEVARAIARKLGGDGLDVELADDPRPVLARLEAGEGDGWDVVLLDVGLPGMSGIDVLRRFREANSLASIVMLTGDNSANTATTCMRAGAFYYLTKPFRPYELSSMVESAARYSTLRRELAGVRQLVDDVAERSPEAYSPAALAGKDDKWLFSRSRIEISARNAGFDAVRFVPHNDHASLYRDVAATHLRLSVGHDRLRFPDWAGAILDRFDAALSLSAKRELMVEGTIVLSKGA